MRIDAEKGIGPELRDKYNLPGFPTIVFIKANGSEVDRIVGYRPAAIFLGEMERINRNEGTIDDLSHQLASYPEDDSLIVRIAEKYEER
ncbi:MAG: thioredoxin family protein, partial [Candidatus Marinimicrobia bacterium]|nr:thioredoxin family protein [Candidatus Neomarinimicrobiota bacterium]